MNLSAEDFDNVPENFDVLSKKFNNLPNKIYGNESITKVGDVVKLVHNRITTERKKGKKSMNVKITSNMEVVRGSKKKTGNMKNIHFCDGIHIEQPTKKSKKLEMGKKRC